MQATTNDIGNSSVYASIESSDSNVLHIIAINKNCDSAIIANFIISSPGSFDTASIWGFDSSSSNIISRGNISVASNQLITSIPPLSVYHFILRRKQVTGVQSLNENLSFDIFPNPSHQMLGITTSINEFTYSIFDLAGREILRGTTTKLIDVSTLSSGMFYIRTMDLATGSLVIRRFIKD